MLQPVLDPFHRPAELARCERNQDDVGINALLDAEAAPARWGGDQAQLMAAHAERIAHDGMQRVRALEIRPDGVTAIARVVVGYDAVGFDRRRIDARIGDLEADDAVRLRECVLRIAVAKPRVRARHWCRAPRGAQARRRSPPPPDRPPRLRGAYSTSMRSSASSAM